MANEDQSNRFTTRILTNVNIPRDGANALKVSNWAQPRRNHSGFVENRYHGLYETFRRRG